MEFVLTEELDAADRARLMRAVEPTSLETEDAVRSREEARARRNDTVGK